MKCALLLLTVGLCLAGALGARSIRGTLASLVVHEVHAMLAADKTLTVADCTTKCDALFDLVVVKDETHTDDICHAACSCQIHPHTCHHFTTHAHGPHRTTTTAAPRP